jgi:hypothetical protein
LRTLGSGNAKVMMTLPMKSSLQMQFIVFGGKQQSAFAVNPPCGIRMAWTGCPRERSIVKL